MDEADVELFPEMFESVLRIAGIGVELLVAVILALLANFFSYVRALVSYFFVVDP